MVGTPIRGNGPTTNPIDSLLVDMTTKLGSIKVPAPVFTASGCAASGKELDQFFDISAIGGMVTKSIMLQPRSGRATPRMAETASGMLNGIGLQGPGINEFIENDLAWLENRKVRTVVSIAGSTVEEYGKLARKIKNLSWISAVEVNISCPNVESRGQVFACDPVASAAAVLEVRRSVGIHTPVIAKLSPDVTDITAIAQACVDAGADGVAMINTLLGMVIDTSQMRPVLSGGTGGLSGPAIKPVAVRAIWQVHQALPNLPILGMGGIRSGKDALEFILAGASAVSIGTMIFNDPSAPWRIQKELRDELGKLGFAKLTDAIGYAHTIFEGSK
jgi:dihydroorotate dehydrogenase (NAD+) catalytic subunit